MSMSWDHEVLRQLDEREAADSGSELSDHDEAPMELCEEVSTVLPSTDPASTVDENAALRQLSSLRHHISSLEEVGVRSNEGSAERAAAELSSDSPLNQEKSGITTSLFEPAMGLPAYFCPECGLSRPPHLLSSGGNHSTSITDEFFAEIAMLLDISGLDGTTSPLISPSCAYLPSCMFRL